MDGVSLGGIGIALPGNVVTNDDMRLDHPTWRMELVESKTGVYSRHIAGPDETALDLAETACRNLLRAHEGLSERIDGIIFCTQTPDYVMPPNACLLQARLGLGDAVMAFDMSMACSGFVYGLAVAQGLIAARTCTNVLVVTADTYSKLINPDDRSARSLFGDGAAVTLVTGGPGSVIVDVICETAGSGFKKFYVPAGGMRMRSTEKSREIVADASGNLRSLEEIHMDGMGVLSFANAKVPSQIRRLLERNALNVIDVDLVVFHQASKLAIDSLARLMGFSERQVFRNLATVGNTVSASVPIALSQAMAEGRARPGGLVLLCGFGVGLSWASALVRM